MSDTREPKPHYEIEALGRDRTLIRFAMQGAYLSKPAMFLYILNRFCWVGGWLVGLFFIPLFEPETPADAAAVAGTVYVLSILVTSALLVLWPQLQKKSPRYTTLYFDRDGVAHENIRLRRDSIESVGVAQPSVVNARTRNVSWKVEVEYGRERLPLTYPVLSKLQAEAIADAVMEWIKDPDTLLPDGPGREMEAA